MAQDISLMGAQYSAVPAVELPKTGGGTARFTDTSGVTATAADVASGKVFVDASGEEQTGTASGGGGATVEPLSITENGTYTAPEGVGYSPVTVNVAGGGGEWWDTPDPTDGKTHIWIEIPEGYPESRRTMTIRVRFKCEIDWGDGTVETCNDGISYFFDNSHLYAASGHYEITVAKAGASGNEFGGDSSHCLVGSSVNANLYKAQWVKRIFFGDNVNLSSCAYVCQYFHNLKKVSLPYTPYATYMFRSCYGLEEIQQRVELGNVIGSYSLYSDFNLKSYYILKSVQIIGTYAFSYCISLVKLVIPASVTTIQAYAFSNCTAMKEFHFEPTTPPTLSNANAFTNIPSDCVFYVKYSEDHSILEAYKAATNWSTYASRMVEEEPE